MSIAPRGNVTANRAKSRYSDHMTRFALLLIALFSASPLWAEGPEITRVDAEKSGMSWKFHVTILHGDTGWDHYADGWEVLDAKGNRLGYRKLLHPHVDEQPFTRSLNGVTVPDGMREVYVRARCSQGDWTSEAVKVDLRY